MTYDVKASSIARTVFVWIALVILMVGLIWTAVTSKKVYDPRLHSHASFRNGVNSVKEGIETGASVFAPAAIGIWLHYNGGKVLTAISMTLLIIYEAFWQPHRHLDEYVEAKKAEASKKN